MSIYTENTGADIGAGGLRQSRVGVGGDLQSGDSSELVVPDYGGVDAGGDDAEPVPASDPSALIAEFKAKREKHETWGLMVVLTVLVVIYVGLPALQYVDDPDVNPFKEDINGTVQLTPTGVEVYAYLFPTTHFAEAAIVSSGLPLEDVVAKFQWSVVAAGKVPATSVALWIYFAMGQWFTAMALEASYGWPSMALFVAVWFRFLVAGGLCFAEEPVEPNSRNMLMRRPTAYEHRITTEVAFMVSLYVPFDLYCIKEGQWDGKTVGRTGAMLMVFLELAWIALWYFKWGRDALLAAGAPRVAKCEGKSREDLFAEAILFGLMTYPVHGLLHHMFLFPDIPDNAELVTMESQPRPGDIWMKYSRLQIVPLFPFIFFRKQIFSVLKASLQKKQRLRDGAFIAALLVDDGADDLISEATELFRGVPFSKITADLLRSSKGTQVDYALSRPCKLSSVDFFVSHSETANACFVLS
jgi:hypothetical protein